MRLNLTPAEGKIQPDHYGCAGSYMVIKNVINSCGGGAAAMEGVLGRPTVPPSVLVLSFPIYYHAQNITLSDFPIKIIKQNNVCNKYKKNI